MAYSTRFGYRVSFTPARTRCGGKPIAFGLAAGGERCGENVYYFERRIGTDDGFNRARTIAELRSKGKEIFVKEQSQCQITVTKTTIVYLLHR